MSNQSPSDVAADASFETIYERLEQAVGRLEAGGLSLDESIGLYESGMQLARRCRELLDAAELRVSELEQEFAVAGVIQDPENEESD